MQKIWRSLFILALFGFSWGIAMDQEDDKRDSLDQSVQNEEKTTNDLIFTDALKNGILLGIELNGGLGEIIQNGSINFIDPLPYRVSYKSPKKVFFDGGLKIGYQHYFGLGLGVRISGYVGVGNPIEQKFSIKKVSITNIIIDFKSLYLPIKTGVDFEGLWDFWEEGKHTLSLSFGVGYRFSCYKNLKNLDNDLFWDVSFSDVIIHEVYPQIGLSYYYGRHQISLSYKFGDLLSSKSGDRMSEIIERDPVEDLKRGEILTRLVQSSYFSIGYGYRF